MPPPLAIRALGTGDAALMQAMRRMFAAAFEEPAPGPAAAPSDAYLDAWLAERYVIALAALAGSEVVGGLVAYELRKYERERGEIYLYDLAVAAAHRRQGIATALIRTLQGIAAARGAQVIFVQADLADAPAIALYGTLGAGMQVLHFDIPVRYSE
jgi:aminoglycoside 3-N-acetyltransferase I